jgi:hypothetical protein
MKILRLVVALSFFICGFVAADEIKVKCITPDEDKVVFKMDGNKIYRCNRRGKNCYDQVITKKETVGNEKVLTTADGIETRLSSVEMNGVKCLAVAWRANDLNWVSPNNTSSRDDLFFCEK